MTEWYQKLEVEPWDAIRAWSKHWPGKVSFDLGNVVKYVARAYVKHEDPLPDLRKAASYLRSAITRLEIDQNSDSVGNYLTGRSWNAEECEHPWGFREYKTPAGKTHPVPVCETCKTPRPPHRTIP